MELTVSDRADVERILGNLAEFERILADPAMPLNAPEWAGTLSVNVKELLEIVARLAARETELLEELPGRAAAECVPSGTGWPVP